ncbi:helix-turn-helix domain-containing protein [Christiangramia sp. SM2212]|uniref:Helix-turn-helix domain-containing protein n=1 Tax=Christiangramia sediminicola TaxID=3073267 RepID=A0ABU1ES32_9FLAO|nr:helix-turn-helix domain-containing protein [Christiangramia sp. SM2212]MDR5591205.1 helix-turn-helix domain-containing protein [Christiangramia sp. SM2212]
MGNVTQLHETTPDELTRIIFEGLDKRLEDFKKNFQPKEPEEFLTRQEVCELLSISYGTLHQWVKKGILQPLTKGGRVYYSRKQIVKDLYNSNPGE